MNNLLSILLVFAYIALAMFSGQCDKDENPITPPTPTDSNIKIFNDLTVSEFYNNGSYSDVNLYEGKVVRANDDLNRDIHLADSLFASINAFYLRSGDLSLDAPGYETKFDFKYSSMTQGQFDTLSYIDVGNRPIDPLIDFPYTMTNSFYTPLSKNSVYSFYLKGRYSGGFNQGKRVYGLLYIDSTWKTAGDTFKLRIDVKINKAEQNQFNPNHP